MQHRKRFGRNYAYAGTVEAKQLGMRMRWGGDDQPSAPAPAQVIYPSAPSAADSMADYIAGYPALANLQMQYNPLIAANDKATNELLYPNTAGLQETIAGQAKDALAQDVPQWYQSQVADTLSAKLGRNLVYNPQAQESYGLNTQAAFKDYGDYWRNLSLSAAGRQPLAVPTQTMTQNYTPNAAMSMASNTYGTQAGMYNAGLGYNSSIYNTQMSNPPSNPWMNMAGSIAGGAVGAFTGGWGYAKGSKMG